MQQQTEEVFFLKEIENVDWVSEILSEKFDNAAEMMPRSSIIYGDAIRNCIAGKDLPDVLDIAVSSMEYSAAANNFGTHPKWISPTEKYDNIELKASSKSVPRVQSIPNTKPSIADDESPYARIERSDQSLFKSRPSSVHYVTTNGSKVNLVLSPKRSHESFENALYVARSVDFICCGIIMLPDGRVFEVIPEAYKDCTEGIIRINQKLDSALIGNISVRIENAKTAGWEIDDSVSKDVKRISIIADRAKKKSSSTFIDLPTMSRTKGSVEIRGAETGRMSATMATDQRKHSRLSNYEALATINLPKPAGTIVPTGKQKVRYNYALSNGVISSLYGNDKTRFSKIARFVCSSDGVVLEDLDFSSEGGYVTLRMYMYATEENVNNAQDLMRGIASKIGSGETTIVDGRKLSYGEWKVNQETKRKIPIPEPMTYRGDVPYYRYKPDTADTAEASPKNNSLKKYNSQKAAQMAREYNAQTAKDIIGDVITGRNEHE